MTVLDHDPRKTLVIILAGGQGERLYPLTRDRAKPAVPFAGAYRIIDFTLSNCLNSGLRRVYVLTQYKSLSLERHIRSGWSLLNERLGEFIIPIPPQQRLGGSWYQGTADAIFQNIYTLERERPSTVVVLSGDHVYKMDYRDLVAYHWEKGGDLTVACLEVPREETRHFGIAVVDDDGRILKWQEKPSDPEPMPGREDCFLASMGVYVFNTEVLVRRVSRDAKRSTSHDFGKDVIPAMIDTDRVYAFPFENTEGEGTAYWRDIGRIDAYYDANLDLVSPDPQFSLYDEDWPIWICPRSSPPAKTMFSGQSGGLATNCLISPGVRVIDAVVESSVLGFDVTIEPEAEVKDCIIHDQVTVGRGARLSRVIVDKRVRIPPGTEIG
ncbi:MAG: glucose-1-phosphate adenylyltransferase, partial [Planctomycetota bacterium]